MKPVHERIKDAENFFGLGERRSQELVIHPGRLGFVTVDYEIWSGETEYHSSTSNPTVAMLCIDTEGEIEFLEIYNEEDHTSTVVSRQDLEKMRALGDPDYWDFSKRQSVV